MDYRDMTNDNLLKILDGSSLSIDANNYNLCLENTPKEIALFFRGDNRTKDEIGVNGGFTPLKQATDVAKSNFVKAFCNQNSNEINDFIFWNEFRSSQKNSEYGKYFVSASLTDAQLGANAYKIELPVRFYFLKKCINRDIYIGLCEDLNGKTIRAIKLNENEVIFLDPIPQEYITSIS